MRLHDYDLICINTSAGKDSQTVMRFVMLMAGEQQFPVDRIVGMHADLGDAE